MSVLLILLILSGQSLTASATLCAVALAHAHGDPAPALGGALAPNLATVLADFVPPAPAGTGQWLMSAFWVCGTALFILKGVESFQRTFGRKPPIDEDLRRLRDELQAEIKKAVAGLASLQKVTALELAIEKSMGARFDALDEKRSDSIDGLHRDLDATARELRDKMDSLPAQMLALLDHRRGGRN